MSDSEITRIFTSIDNMAKSIDDLKESLSEFCLKTTERFGSMDNRISLLEQVAPLIEKQKQRKFEWITKFAVPFISQFLGFFLAYLLFRMTKG